MTEVAYAGAGGTAYTGAALLRSLAHGVTLWSPRGQGTADLLQRRTITSAGYVNGKFDVKAVERPAELVQAADLIFVAIPAHAQKTVFDALLPHLEDWHTVVIGGGPLGGGGLHLQRRLAEAGKRTKVALTNGPIIGGRRISGTECATAPYRTMVTVAGIPGTDSGAVIAKLEEVYGKRFRLTPSGNAFELALSSINGVVHAAQVIGNITRIEEAEMWCGYRYTTDSIGRLTEALDADRVAVAKGFGFDLPGVVRHFDPSGKTRTAQEAIQPISFRRTYRNGPRRIDTRYIEEEIPYSLYAIEELGRKVGVLTPMISNMINIFNATRAKDYRKLNDFAGEIGLATASAEEFAQLWKTGFTPERQAATQQETEKADG